MHGLSNWTEIADHVSTKSKTQCHSHYYEKYMARAVPIPGSPCLRSACDSSRAGRPSPLLARPPLGPEGARDANSLSVRPPVRSNPRRRRSRT